MDDYGIQYTKFVPLLCKSTGGKYQQTRCTRSSLRVGGRLMTRSVVQLGGQALKLDADGDTTIEVSSDDVLVVDTAGNEALKIDANGIITKPLQPAFSCSKKLGQLSLGSVGSYHDVTFELERFDVGGNFASNQFTALK